MPWNSNIASVVSRFDEISAKVAKRVRLIIIDIIYEIDEGVHARTPVHSGKAVRNMIWTKGAPNAVEFPAIESPADPGHTSAMAIGNEPRRAANEAAARATLRAIKVERPFGTYYLSNVADHIVDLEHGQLPSPEASRAPHGMFGVTYAEVMSKLRAGAYTQ